LEKVSEELAVCFQRHPYPGRAVATPLGFGIRERGLEWAVGARGPSPACTVRGKSSLQRQPPPVGAAGEGIFWPTV